MSIGPAQKEQVLIVEDTAAWHDFYLMAGGAAAVLAGLIFVALSLRTSAIMAHPLYRDRAFASMLSLMSQVFLSAAMLVPAQPAVALGIEVEVVAVGFLVRTGYAVWLVRGVNEPDRRRPRFHWFIEWSAWLVWLFAFLVSGVALMNGAALGFYLLALSMIYMFGSNVWNAWVLISEVSE